jgi:hypothetical protein
MIAALYARKSTNRNIADEEKSVARRVSPPLGGAGAGLAGRRQRSRVGSCPRGSFLLRATTPRR